MLHWNDYYRMYPDNLRQVIEGWGKAFVSGARQTKRFITLLISVWFMGSIIVSALISAGLLFFDEINTIIDAYCGSGLFSVFLSSLARVTGIEINEQAVQYARINAANHGIQNIDFIQGDVEAVLCKNFRAPQEKIDLFVLDPPRIGCEQIVLKSMVDLHPRKIMYISCNPATQARDIKYLNEYGYRLKSLQPLDMFPQTQHIEVIGYLELR